MKASLTHRANPNFRWGRSVALAITLAILMPIAPNGASAKGGGPLHLFAFYMARSVSTTGSVVEATAVVLGGCGGKRYRDPNTHRCRGPAEFHNWGR